MPPVEVPLLRRDVHHHDFDRLIALKSLLRAWRTEDRQRAGPGVAAAVPGARTSSVRLGRVVGAQDAQARTVTNAHPTRRDADRRNRRPARADEFSSRRCHAASSSGHVRPRA